MKTFDYLYARELTEKARGQTDAILEILYENITIAANKGNYLTVCYTAGFNDTEISIAADFLRSRGFSIDYVKKGEKYEFFIDWS